MLNFIKKNIVKIIALFILIVFLDFWVGSIIKCEILTYKHGAEFSDAVNRFNMVDVDYYKVIKYDYDDHMALVYCVARGGAGITMSFKENGNATGWIYLGWRTVWSSSGSADDFIWPYIR
ncbi:MAG TPA: hypothetical protein PLV03_05425 [Clostridiales bacterium]|nr:hypothetical protein [Clostridiales bacterium]